MSKRSIRGVSPSAAHKRQAVAPQDEEGPLLQLASASSSLAQQASPFSIPTIPLHLIADLILPFIADRVTWNSVCSASNELRRAGKKMTPPWPSKSFNLGHNAHMHYVAFSPSGSQLAFGINNYNTDTDHYVVHVWDRWGEETLLGGDTGFIRCLEYSLDGEHLASGSRDGSIRIWYTESFHTTPSNPDSERPTRTPKQPDTLLLGSRNSKIMELSFSRTDSNLLASGGSNGEIKVWNIKEQACIHSFDYGRGERIRSLFFAGGADIACLAVTHTMSIIRLWKAVGTSDFASETIGYACRGRAKFSPSGSFLTTTRFGSRTGNASVALYELETMTKTQSVVMPNFTANYVAVSPDSKQLVIGDYTGRIRLLQTDDLSIQRDLDARGEVRNVLLAYTVAFDPTCRFLAFGCQNGIVIRYVEKAIPATMSSQTWDQDQI
jgi:WD40 repeat protein